MLYLYLYLSFAGTLFYLFSSNMNANLSRLSTRYISLSQSNTDDVNGFTPAEINVDFPRPIIDKADDWIMAIERMDLNANAVPLYDADQNERGNRTGGGDYLILVRKATGAVLARTRLIQNCYNIPEFEEYIHDAVSVKLGGPDDPATDTLVTLDGVVTQAILDNSTFNFYLGEDDRWVLQINGLQGVGGAQDNWGCYAIYFMPSSALVNGAWVDVPGNANNCKSNLIVGIRPSDILLIANNSQYVYSHLPRSSLGDSMSYLALTSNLPVAHDSQGQAQINILTDFAVPDVWQRTYTPQNNAQMTANGIALESRDRIIYNPNQYRFIDLQAPVPIYNILIQAQYVSNSGVHKIVQLPFGATFAVKLVFFKRG